MSRKVYVKPPPTAKTMFVAQIVIGTLFIVFGIGLFIAIYNELGEALPFVALFFLIWTAVCSVIIAQAVKTLRLINKGKIEIAEFDNSAGWEEGSFAAKLRDLEALKKDGLISDEEYQKKRAEIMQGKW